jgi:hypothetical protein
MSNDMGLTAIHEDDVSKHLETAHGLVTRATVTESAAPAPAAASGRGYVSTLPPSLSAARSSRSVELAKTVEKAGSGKLLSPQQHSVVYRAMRGAAVGLSVADAFARKTALEGLRARNLQAPLSGEDGLKFKSLNQSAAYVSAFTFAAYLLNFLETEGEAPSDVDEPDYLFDNPTEALKSLVSGLDKAISGAAEDVALVARARAFARVAIEGLVERKGRFDALAPFLNAHIRVEKDDFTIDGFDAAPGRKSKALSMTFKKPEDIVGNHIAKYQAMKLAKMLVAFDFEKQLNPFVELGGFLFTFIGDGNPGTGKTVLIQMTAGLLDQYCRTAGYQFHYENFGVDQISSYQGKSGQSCKQFINNVLNPKAIGFGTIDDIDQVAGKRNDDKASSGQQEVTAVLMESFAGATTVVRGNASFGMFSNYPENVDDALRQRAGARWLVDGPQTRDDYIDIFTMLVGKNHSISLGDHEFLAGQQIKKAVGESYAKHDVPQEPGLVAVYEKFLGQNGELRTLADVGAYLHMIKEAEPRFTGRAIKNITDSIKMRAMDVDLPDEWFENTDLFLRKSYDEKKAMVEALRTPITMSMILQSINQYADSEFRYTDKSDDAAIAEMIAYHRRKTKAEGMIRSGEAA